MGSKKKKIIQDKGEKGQQKAGPEMGEQTLARRGLSG